MHETEKQKKRDRQKACPSNVRKPLLPQLPAAFRTATASTRKRFHLSLGPQRILHSEAASGRRQNQPHQSTAAATATVCMISASSQELRMHTGNTPQGFLSVRYVFQLSSFFFLFFPCYSFLSSFVFCEFNMLEFVSYKKNSHREKNVLFLCSIFLRRLLFLPIWILTAVLFSPQCSFSRQAFSHGEKKHCTLRVEKTAASGLGTWATLPRPDALRHLTVPPGYIYLTTYFHFLLFSPICIFFIFQLCVSFFLSTYLYSFFSSFFYHSCIFCPFSFFIIFTCTFYFCILFVLIFMYTYHFTSWSWQSQPPPIFSQCICMFAHFFFSFFVLHTLGCVLFYFCISLRV